MAATAKLLSASLIGAVAVCLSGCGAVPHSRGQLGNGSAALSRPVQLGTSTPTTRPPTATTANSTIVQQPHGADTFTLVVNTSQGSIQTAVAPISVASRQPVDPPHHTPQQWNTAAWVVQASYPASESRGTTYVYGHACHHHTCPFTKLDDTHIGNTVQVFTPRTQLTYRVSRIGLSPKSAGTLPRWASNSRIANRLILVTCEYEQGDISTNNLIVEATRA